MSNDVSGQPEPYHSHTTTSKAGIEVAVCVGHTSTANCTRFGAQRTLPLRCHLKGAASNPILDFDLRRAVELSRWLF